jgi:predicted ferric reductase
VRRAIRGVTWLTIYLAACVAPLFFAAFGDAPPGRTFWHELSVALGFVGLAVLALQFAVTARLRRVTAPYGMDVVIQFHRQISYVALGMVLAHPVLLVFTEIPVVSLLNPIDTTWPARFGLASVVALFAIVATSWYKDRLGLSYEAWRLLHGVLAVVILAAALVHIQLVGHYVAQTWKQVLWSVMTLSVVGLLAYVRVVRPLLLLRRPWVVDEVRERRGDAWSVVLRPEGHEGLRFEPGQFTWLSVAGHPFGIEEHPFSFSSSAEQHDTVELTVKALGDFTSQVGDIQPGARTYLDGPYGAFTTDRNEAPGFLFVGGGIGITPIVSMLRTLADRGDERPMALVYAVKDPDEATFRDEVADLEERLKLRVVLVPEVAPDQWPGPSGFVDAEVLAQVLPERRELWQCFVCGPDPMMDVVERALHDLGVPADHVNLERFNLV